MATPKGKSKASDVESDETGTDMESARLYEDLRARLIQIGIPAKEIAFIHDADTDAKKKKLFADVNDGKVRVLIGSTGKMGVGMNAQKRIVAIHHLDAPWRPGDVEQRNGRAFRQGNINDEVYDFTYVTEKSFDARLWDILERKQNFIDQIMNGENVGRDAEDTGEVTLSAAEVKALSSGNPLIGEQVQLDTDIKKLESLYRAHRTAVTNAVKRLAADRSRIASLEIMIANGKVDLETRVDTYSEGRFSITIGKTRYTDKKEAGVRLMAEASARANMDGYTTIGKFAGFEIRVIKTSEGINGLLFGAQGYSFKTYPGNTTYMVNHLIARAEGLDESVAQWESELSALKADMAEQEKLVSQPFARQAELDQKRARYNEVMEILNPKEEQNLDNVDDDEERVSHQARSYLSEEARKFREDIDNWNKNGRPDDETFVLGSTGAVLQGLGAIESDIYMQSDKINSIMQKHTEMSIKEIKAIPEILENPVMVLASRNVNRNKQENTRLVIYGMVKAQNNIPMMIAFELRPNENGFYLDDMQKVVSAYTKDRSLSATMEFMENSQILYADKEKTTSLLHSAGFQNAYSVERSGYVGNISYEGQRVNISGVPFSDVVQEISAQHQARVSSLSGNSLSDRDVLKKAAENVRFGNYTDAQKEALETFKKRLERLQNLEAQLSEQTKIYQELQADPDGNAGEIADALKEIKWLRRQISAANNALFEVEETRVLRNVLKKARAVVEEQEREYAKKTLKRYRDRRDNAEAIKKYRERLRHDVDELTGWVLHPNNKDAMKHIPDALKGTVIPFLSSIDFMSKQSLRGGNPTQADARFLKQLNSLKSALSPDENPTAAYLDYSDLPPDFMAKMQKLINAVGTLAEQKTGDYVINQMTSEELRDLSGVVRNLKKEIQNFNSFHVNAMFKHVYDAGDNTIDSLSQMRSAGPHNGKVDEFLLWEHMRPAFAFERFGEGGKSVWGGLAKGQAKLAFNAKEIAAFSEKAYTTKEVREWEDDVREINLGKDKGTVKMTVAHIMSLYELSKRKQALGHILGGGVRVATFMSKGKKVTNDRIITGEDLNTIFKQLTPRQKAVADSLQQYMQEQGGKWGNFVSMKRFGERLFGEDHYFPINSDGRHLSVNAEEKKQGASLYALLNMGFTKELQEGANNRIVLYSIFDVFSNHMASMAQYNALALPVIDAIKWFNYQQKSDPDEKGKRLVTGSVRDQMDRVYGVAAAKNGKEKRGYAQNFVINIIKAFNGTEAQGTPADQRGLNALHRYNAAQVAYNLRVVVQQPLAITRAALVLKDSSVLRGVKLSPKAISQNIAEMQKYSGIAAWKSLGFYDTNISRGLTALIKHDENWAEKVNDFGMKGAEFADRITWATIWSAAKNDVIHNQHLTPRSEGFYQAVAERFEETIYKTQVVDSVLTKSEFMRDKGFLARAVGSFMSEPVTTASMLVDAFEKQNADMRRGMSFRQAWKKNGKHIVHTVYLYVIGQTLLAAAQSFLDALRDDDDYETYWEKWFEAFKGNLLDELMPFNKLPILSDFYDLTKELLAAFTDLDIYGNPPQSVFMQWYDSLSKGVTILNDLIRGNETDYTWYGGAYKLLQAVSGASGLPLAAVTRTAVNAWNTIIGHMAPSLKVKTYDPGELRSIKYAYQDGYLTDEEASDLLVQKELVDTEDEAYWKLQEWEGGDGYSRYQEIFSAVLLGQNINSAMDELTAHGYTEKDVLSTVKSRIGKWYKEGHISKQKAIELLNKYFDLDKDEITAIVNRWSSTVVTGINFEDIKDEYLNGKITAKRAAEMYVLYGGYTKERANEIVTQWGAERDTGVAYSDIEEAFMEGDISQRDALNMYVEYGGYTREEAQEKVTVLAFVKKHPECEGVTYAAIENYETYCEPTGVSARNYYDAWKFYSSAVADVDEDGKSISGSKKEKVLEYINGLSLTSAQKDSLYLAFGWSDRTLDDAPWHQ